MFKVLSDHAPLCVFVRLIYYFDEIQELETLQPENQFSLDHVNTGNKLKTSEFKSYRKTVLTK